MRTGDYWWWEVFRDDVLVGRLASRNRGTLDSESRFDAYATDGRPLGGRHHVGVTTYDTALRLIHEASP
jgi:hypothetical protein